MLTRCAFAATTTVAVALLSFVSEARASDYYLAEVTPAGPGATFEWTGPTSLNKGELIPYGGGSLLMEFALFQSPGGALQRVPALMTSDLTVNDDGIIDVSGYVYCHGTLSFKYAGVVPLMFNGLTYSTGADLLTVSYNNAGVYPGTSGIGDQSYSATSDLLDMANFQVMNTNFFFSEQVLTGLWATGYLNSAFSARAWGEIGNGVPEPSSWELLLLGFGLGGLAVRKKGAHAESANKFQHHC